MVGFQFAVLVYQEGNSPFEKKHIPLAILLVTFLGLLYKWPF